jgi:hypothetical protein
VSSPSSRSKRRTPQKAQSKRGVATAPVATASGAAAVRRPSLTRASAPVDYSKDYADVRGDLIRIGILTALLIGAMIAVSFFV